MTLRADHICERTLSPWQIRDELARQIKIWRKYRETCEVHLAEIAIIKIRTLKWVLQHDDTNA
jgi:hypothetical protein